MKKRIIKIVFYTLLLVISFYYTIRFLNDTDVSLDSSTLELLLESSGNIEPKNRIINNIVNTIRETDILNPVSVVLNDYKSDEVVKVSNEIEIIDNSPIVYIYNTHQVEKYNSTKEINLNYSVIDASFYLQKKLKEYDINSIVETMSIQDILSTNNWNYSSSYRVSKMFMEKRKKENNSLNYYIDLHRDSVEKSISTVTINGIKYAKTMFLLGLENANYKENEKHLINLENWLNDNYNGLSRGIYRKKGKGVNGVYNQDFSEYCILIEVGGEENTYEEVENTIDVIAEMLKDFIGGKIE